MSEDAPSTPRQTTTRRHQPRDPGDTAQARTLGQKLAYLREQIRRPDGRKYTYQQIAVHVAEVTGGKVDRSYMSALRSGQRDNPTKAVLEALGSFFSVSPAFFFDDEESRRIAEQIDLVVALRNRGLLEPVMRMLAELPEDENDRAADLIRSVLDRRSDATE